MAFAEEADPGEKGILAGGGVIKGGDRVRAQSSLWEAFLGECNWPGAKNVECRKQRK